MIAAIYSRKSTEQTVADEAKSVTRQIDHARAYAASKGWTVDDEHVYVDDGISGAEFAKRPGFMRLMNALTPRAPFQVLIMSEESRLGREAIETAYSLKQIIVAGVRIFFYLEDRERTLDSPIEKIMLSIQTMADEMEREKARQRMIDTMARKAKAGHVTGGKCFGYDNVAVTGPGGERSHVERRINEAEAAIVRRIFEMSAAGCGFSRIAQTLNADGAPSPSPQQDRPKGWAPTSVKAVIERTAYRGEITWNRTQKRDRWGQRRHIERPGTDWCRKEAPELRIVSDALWTATHDRLAGIRRQLGTWHEDGKGRRHRDVDSKYLLTGFARCAACGGGLGIVRGGASRGTAIGCLAAYKRGASVCRNRLALPITGVEDAVLNAIVGQVLRPAVVDAIVAGVLEALKPTQRATEGKRLQADLRAVEGELASLATAVAQGGALTPLLTAIQERQVTRDGLVRKLAVLEGAQTATDPKTIERQVRAKLAQWKGLLTGNREDGRQFLREALVGPLRFTPENRQYRFTGEVAIDRMLSGVVGLPSFVASPGGLRRRYHSPGNCSQRRITSLFGG